MEWRNEMNTGRWKYKRGFFYIEFSAKNSPTKRQHILREIEDGHAVLLPAGHPKYIDNAHFSTKSAIHRNTKNIVMQKLVPLVSGRLPSSPPKRQRTSGIYQTKANDE